MIRISFTREAWGVYECHYSCEDCDPNTSCKEGMTCYNDYLFVEFLVDVLVLDLKVDVNRIHITGLSNGAQFSYYLASYSNYKFASFGIVAGVPFIGFGALPPYKTAIIDFHGTQDTVIPYSAGSHGSYGLGPVGEVSSVISYDGMYYLEKPQYIDFLVSGFQCESAVPYPTNMDGTHQWSCDRFPCGESDIVACSGHYGHEYPFHDVLDGVRILWGFMKNYSTSEA